MRPGPYPWATDDIYVSGGNPWHNQPTKTEPSPARLAEGAEPTDIWPGDYMNWLWHKYHVHGEESARAMAMNFKRAQVESGFGPFANPARKKYVFDHANQVHIAISTKSAVSPAGDQTDFAYLDGLLIDSTNHFAKAAAANVNDAADDRAGHIVTTLSGSTDEVYYAIDIAGAGAWAFITFTGGPTLLSWTKIDCDPSGPWWVMLDDSGGGTTVAWDSPDGITFTANATFPATMGAGVPIDLLHSKHPAGALSPTDAGNPYWIAFNATNMARSLDGITWTVAAHGLNMPILASSTQDRIAYSRTARRWFIPGFAADLGDVYYSDDNGAAWSTFSGVLTPTPTSITGIACDGYGTIIIHDCVPIMKATPTVPFGAQFWISVDDGVTWAYDVVAPSSYGGTHAEFDFRHFGLYDIGTPDAMNGFAMISSDGAACSLDRSLLG